MKVVLRIEGKWAIIEMEQNLDIFLTTIDGEAMTEAQLKKKNTRTHI